MEAAEKLAAEHYEEQLKLLKTMPGVRQSSSIMIMTELGGGIKKFKSAEKLTGWAGRDQKMIKVLVR